MNISKLARYTVPSVFMCVLLAANQSVNASVHLMQIEQVIAGVSGDITAQAIQLRMRLGGQIFTNGTTLTVRDSAGLNPIVLITIPANVANGLAGDRILVVSPGFAAHTNPPTTGAFVMTNLIPASYLAAGTLTFEQGASLFWRISWGGASYTGPTTAGFLNPNDDDGDFGAPFPGVLPSSNDRALRFTGTFSDLSTTNAADYALTVGSAVFTNNARDEFIVLPPAGACCDAVVGVCSDGVTQDDCDGSGRRYGGDDSDCSSIDPPCDPVASISLEIVASGLISPVGLTHAGDGSGRLFVVDQAGFIRVIKNDVLLPTPFLDLTSLIPTLSTGFDERGVLGLAFHPDYPNNGKFYVRYSAPRTGVDGEPCFGTSRGCHEEILSEFLVLGDVATSDVGDLSSERILFRIDEPQFNHDAGDVAFGPDGFLYFSLGDGGGANDGLADNPVSHGPDGNGQNIETALGAILRIDVDGMDTGLEYAIPSDNPFVGVTGVDEIYAYGLRNPYKFSFDRTSANGGDGTLYLGDVGQDLIEEVDIIVKGGNYGWVIKEGTQCFDPLDPLNPPAMCDETGLIDPISEYTHAQGGLSVIGGYVYRGNINPNLVGRYIYGDFTFTFAPPAGRLYYFDTTGPDQFKRREFFLSPNGAPFGRYLKGLGEDENREVYFLASTALAPTGTSGEVLRIVPPSLAAVGRSPRFIEALLPTSPDPFGLLVTPECEGGTPRYVGPPSGPDNVALLVDNELDAAFLTSSEWGLAVRISGATVIPNRSYVIQINTGTVSSPALSAGSTATTSIWADSVGPLVGGSYPPPDGLSDFSDIGATIEAFKGVGRAPENFRVDVSRLFGTGCEPDGIIDFSDVESAVEAFKGFTYSEATGCPDTCD